jgi:hypothetical protein
VLKKNVSGIMLIVIIGLLSLFLRIDPQVSLFPAKVYGSIVEFHSTISPDHVINGTSYIYTITVTNDLCLVGITEINITFPAATWIFNSLIAYSPNTWTPIFSAPNMFVCTGPPILEGSSLTLQVNMTVPPYSAPGEYHYNVSSKDSINDYLGKYSMLVVLGSSSQIWMQWTIIVVFCTIIVLGIIAISLISTTLNYRSLVLYYRKKER